MSHKFLAVEVSRIPQQTKDNIPSFWKNSFSNDNSRMLLDGYNDNNVLVQPTDLINTWLYAEADKEAALAYILATAIEYTKAEMMTEVENPASIWYKGVTDG